MTQADNNSIHSNNIVSQLSQKLEKVIELASSTPNGWTKYSEDIKILRDRLSELAFARELGMAEGYIESYVKGLAIRNKKNFATILSENKTQIACNLKQMGLNSEVIANAMEFMAKDMDKL